MSNAAAKATPINAGKKDAPKPAKAADKKAADEDEDEEEGEAGTRARSTYFLADKMTELGGKREVLKHLKDNKLKEGQAIIKGRQVQLKPVEAFDLV